MIQEGAELQINSTDFNHINNINAGSVLQAEYQNASAIIYDSNFENNTSIEGGKTIQFYNFL